jgi:hypothetical protein
LLEVREDRGETIDSSFMVSDAIDWHDAEASYTQVQQA